MLAAMPSAVLTPVEDVTVKLFWADDAPTTKLVSDAPTLALRPEMLLKAVFSSALVEICPGPEPNVMVWVVPPLTEICIVDVPSAPPAAMIRSSRLMEGYELPSVSP